MPGMNSGLDLRDPAVVAAFKAALVHQGLIALLIFVFVGLSWVSIRAWLTASPPRPGPPPRPPGPRRQPPRLAGRLRACRG